VATAVPVPFRLGFPFDPDGQTKQVDNETRREASNRMSILWIILIVILVLALLGFFSRGRW
jgi:hypothetical protein